MYIKKFASVLARGASVDVEMWKDGTEDKNEIYIYLAFETSLKRLF